MSFCLLRAFPAFLLSLLLLSATVAPLSAQDTAAEPDTTSEVAADPDTAPAEETAEASYPEGLDDPGIDLQELSLRVIPLTVDDLTALSNAWLEIVKEQTTEVVSKQVDIENLPEEQADAARDELAQLTEERGRAFDRYSTVVGNLEKKGGDPALVKQFRDYRNAIVVDEKQNADWQTLSKQALVWAASPDGGVKLAIQIGVILAALIALMTVAGIFRGVSRKVLGRVPNLSKLLQGFIAMIVYWLVIAFGLMVVLSSLGVDITPVFALIGGASFIIAFAFQETLSNLAAGLMIMINRPFDEGDYVTAAGTGGTVKSVSIVSTTVTTPDNQVIVIPNSKVWGDVITNVTASATRRVDLVFGIGYDDSIAEAQKILEDVVAAHPLVLEDPEPTIRVDELGASSVNFICRPWSTSSNYWAVKWDLTRQVKEAFDKAGISIPFPQTDMHIHMRQDGQASSVPFVPAKDKEQQGSPQKFSQGDEGYDGDGDDDR